MKQLGDILQSEEAPITYVTPDDQDWYGMPLPKTEIFPEVYQAFKIDMFVGIRFLKRNHVANNNILGGSKMKA